VTEYRFYYPIQIRYNDLDAQWHVNNARFFTFIEAARFAYLIHLGLFDGKAFHDMEMIVADVQVSFLAQIRLGQNIRVGVRISRMGNKSMDMEAQIEDQDSGETLATSKTVIVAYDYHTRKSIPISERWRQVISAFEGIPPGPELAQGSASK